MGDEEQERMVGTRKEDSWVFGKARSLDKTFEEIANDSEDANKETFTIK